MKGITCPDQILASPQHIAIRCIVGDRRCQDSGSSDRLDRLGRKRSDVRQLPTHRSCGDATEHKESDEQRPSPLVTPEAQPHVGTIGPGDLR